MVLKKNFHASLKVSYATGGVQKSIKIPTFPFHKFVSSTVKLEYLGVVESQLGKKCRAIFECAAKVLQSRQSFGDATISIKKFIKCVKIV